MKKERKYLVLVKNLILKASVGIYPKEKTRKQKSAFRSKTNNAKCSSYIK